MKKHIVLVLMLMLVIGLTAFAESTNFSSLGYSYISTKEAFDTTNTGGDGYYAYLKIDKTVNNAIFYFIEIEDNQIVAAYTEMGRLVDVEMTDTLYVTEVNGHRYIFSFKVSNGNKYMLMAPSVVTDVVFIFRM